MKGISIAMRAREAHDILRHRRCSSLCFQEVLTKEIECYHLRGRRRGSVGYDGSDNSSPRLQLLCSKFSSRSTNICILFLINMHALHPDRIAIVLRYINGILEMSFALPFALHTI